MASPKLCSIAGCGKRHVAHGFCDNHVYRFRKYGDPLGGKNAPAGELLEWLESHKSFAGDGCLVWPFKSRTESGYGQLTFRGRRTKASRVMCVFAHGEPPTPDYHAAHSCRGAEDGCVNPRHLRWATPFENQQDRIKDGTDLRGEANPNTRLSVEHVREIKRMKGVMSVRKLAAMFGVDPTTVSSIHRGKSWTWLT